MTSTEREDRARYERITGRLFSRLRRSALIDAVLLIAIAVGTAASAASGVAPGPIVVIVTIGSAAAGIFAWSWLASPRHIRTIVTVHLLFAVTLWLWAIFLAS